MAMIFHILGCIYLKIFKLFVHIVNRTDLTGSFSEEYIEETLQGIWHRQRFPIKDTRSTGK